MKAKPKGKKRATKYDTKLAVNGTFLEVIQASLLPDIKPKGKKKSK